MENKLCFKIACTCKKSTSFVFIDKTKTFNDLHNEYFISQNVVGKVLVGCDDSDATAVSADMWGLPISVIADTFSVKQIKFVCDEPVKIEKEAPPGSAFDVLMKAQSQKGLPEKRYKSAGMSVGTNSKDDLYNALIDDCKARGLGTGVDGTSECKYILQVVSNALWYITNQHAVINSAAEHKMTVFEVPNVFAEYAGFLDIKRRKLKEQPMRSSELESHSGAIASIVLKPVMSSSAAWMVFKNSVRDLGLCLQAYSEHLNEQSKITAANSESLTPVRCISESLVILECSAKSHVKDEYRLLDSSIQKAAGNPVMFDETLHLVRPFNSRWERFNFFTKVQLSVTVDMLKYAPGGSHTTVVCFVEVPQSRNEQQKQTDSGRFVAAMMPKLPTFHTRAMKRDFKARIQNISRIQPAVLDLMYKELTWDSAAASTPDVQQRLRLIFLGECGLVPDLRVLNPGRQSHAFDVFFEHLETVVNSVTAEDERRHNIAHMSQWLSMRDLMDQTIKLCPAGTPIPSSALVRLQFAPRNPYCHTALTFTSRYQVQYKIQRRQLRVSHVDDHYCAALLKYLKSLSVRLGAAKCLLYFCDDKAKVPIGEPGVTLSTGVRGKKCLAPSTTIVAAADHDVAHKGSLTPSVLLECDIPETEDKSFVRGQVSVFVNDSVFQPANPFRHAVQLIQRIRQKEHIPPILLKYADGGTDHRNTIESVKCSLICIFKELDLDLLIAARCAPGHSWINPAERVMSILNIGLQNCSLSRQRSDEDTEHMLKRCHGMDDVRKAAVSQPDIQKAWTESIKPVTDIICSRFGRLALKDKPVMTCNTVSDDEVSNLKHHLTTMFPDLDLTKLQKATLMKCHAYKQWTEKHCRQRNYTFQVRKCEDESCCKRRKLDADSFNWLPDPMLISDGDHFQPFTEVYGTETTEIHRPSSILQTTKTRSRHEESSSCQLTSSSDQQGSAPIVTTVCKPKTGSTASKNNSTSSIYMSSSISLLADASMYTGQNARATVECVECRKPRVIYSKQRSWSSRHQLELAILLSSNDYSCGSPITSPDNHLHGKVFIRIEMTCQSYIELSYYSTSNRIGSRPGLCCYCAADNTPRDPSLTAKYRTVLPLCEECKAAGFQAVCLRPYGKLSSR